MALGNRWIMTLVLSLVVGCSKNASKEQAPDTGTNSVNNRLAADKKSNLAPNKPAVDEHHAFRGGPMRNGVQPRADSRPAIFDTVGVFRTSNQVRSSAILVDGVAYFGGSDGFFYALDVASGKKRWSVGAPNGVYASPAVWKDIVYVGGLNGHFRALSRDSGNERWSFKAAKAIYSSPVVHQDVVYVGSVDGFVYALDAQTGKEAWRTKLGGDVYASPTVAKNRVYVGSWDKSLHALDAATGKSVWTFPTDNQIFATASYDKEKETVYVSSWDHHLYAIDAQNGAKRWQVKLGGVSRSSPAVSDQVVVVGCDDHKIYAFDTSSGKALWHFKTDAPVYSSPTIATSQQGATVLIGSNDGSIYALQLKDGTLVDKHTTYGKVTSTPFAAEGRIVVGSYDNGLYVFGDSGLSNRPPRPQTVGTCTEGRTKAVHKRYDALSDLKGLVQYRDVKSSHHSGHYSITRYYDGDQLAVAHINAGHEAMNYSEYHYFDGRDLILVYLDVDGEAEAFHRHIYFTQQGELCGCRERGRDESVFRDVNCSTFGSSFEHIQFAEAVGGLWNEDDVIRQQEQEYERLERENELMEQESQGDKYEEAMAYCENQGADDSQMEACINDFVGNYD